MAGTSIPQTHGEGWYLSLMPPNIKGPMYAWLDPSRVYCNQQALKDCIEDLVRPFLNDPIDLVAGIDAMGFILGAGIARRLDKGFVTVRKEGHLCVQSKSAAYSDYTGRRKVLEMRTDVIKPGMRVLMVDQWVETGGTMEAATSLVEEQGASVAGIATICIEDSDGGKRIREKYKCAVSVPTHLQHQFNSHRLDSFAVFHQPGSIQQ